MSDEQRSTAYDRLTPQRKQLVDAILANLESALKSRRRKPSDSLKYRRKNPTYLYRRVKLRQAQRRRSLRQELSI